MFNITIKTKSDTLFASSEGSAIVDSITRHRRNGLPYIPAKTIKGLLKESAFEVTEILNIGDKKIILELFGNEGKDNKGILKFNDAEIKGYDELTKSITSKKLKSSEVLNHFTTIRHQTAMEDGVALNGSLRTTRCLKPNLTFELIFNQNLTEDQKSLFEKACINLRRAGTNRNRGFGLIEVKLDTYNVKKIQNPDVSSNVMIIRLVTPALLPIRSGDANLVSSEKIISGRKILGLLASEYIAQKHKNNEKNIHTEVEFTDLFLNGKVRYSDAYPIAADLCFPIGNHWVTTKEKNRVENDFDESKPMSNYKTIGGFISNDGSQRKSVHTVLDFHNSRNKMNQDTTSTLHTRLTGSNTGDGIYYYESLDEGQEFVFKIEGSEENLKSIYELINNSTDLRIGKSTSTALGLIQITNFDKKWPSVEANDSMPT
jgi:CRISPR-associated protein Csx10